MAVLFEAVVETIDATYRAIYVSTEEVGITQDGMNGFIDRVRLEGECEPTNEGLVHTLIVWVYEMRRGLEIQKATLGRRGSVH